MSSAITIEQAAVAPSPPFILVDGVPNFRDLGGYQVGTSSSQSIRRGYIYRCGDPYNATKDGINTMQQLGITHSYDLRSKNEIERNIISGRAGAIEWEGCERVFVPVFLEQDYSPERLAARFGQYAKGGTEGFSRAYGEILKSAAPSYRTMFLHIANEPTKPFIVHCTAGKDRTGVFCALLLSICGVADDLVAREYQLTEVGMPPEWKAMVIQHLLEDPAIKGDMSGALNMISARSDNMLATLKLIDKVYGGVERYLIEQCGLQKEDIKKIRDNLIVKEDAKERKPQYSL